MNNHTIIAVATPAGRGGIAVIRLSGTDSIAIASQALTADIANKPSHTVSYGHIKNADGGIIDECLSTVMHAPKTYTREDVVEISLHGSSASVKEAFACLVTLGAVPASAGEFTKRAFLNGRIDLSQAEAVIDIINADTSPALKAAVNQLGGGISEQINAIRTNLITLLAAIQVSADYADEGIEGTSDNEIITTLNTANQSLTSLLETAKQGKIIREGIKTVIAGSPNCGKSSLLNALVGEQRAIVTDIPGTTRDVIEEYVDIGGVALRLLDTAGIRHTADIIEQQGVERAKSHIKDADLVIFVTDRSVPTNQSEQDILKEAKGKVITVANKADLPPSPQYNHPNATQISCLTHQGIDKLKQTIKNEYLSGNLQAGRDALITNVRHQQALTLAATAVEDAINLIHSGMPQDLIFIDLQNAIEALGEITGMSVSDEIVDNIFKNFCVGK